MNVTLLLALFFGQGVYSGFYKTAARCGCKRCWRKSELKQSIKNCYKCESYFSLQHLPAIKKDLAISILIVGLLNQHEETNKAQSYASSLQAHWSKAAKYFKGNSFDSFYRSSLSPRKYVIYTTNLQQQTAFERNIMPPGVCFLST